MVVAAGRWVLNVFISLGSNPVPFHEFSRLCRARAMLPQRSPHQQHNSRFSGSSFIAGLPENSKQAPRHLPQFPKPTRQARER